ncbi:MAG: thioredoxin fold domain-containing protein, partial [Chlorobi bacterium]|nr:thioredoxin fold domain-containing protein [Chlorobiota bacterium]
MKSIFTFFLIFAALAFSHAQQTVEYGGLQWYLDYEEAKAVAQKEGKPIVILFTGSDWCAPCKALRREVFPHPEFQKEARGVVLVMADFPRFKPLPAGQYRKNKELAARFLGRSGLPTMVAVDWRTGKVIRKITG